MSLAITRKATAAYLQQFSSGMVFQPDFPVLPLNVVAASDYLELWRFYLGEVCASLIRFCNENIWRKVCTVLQKVIIPHIIKINPADQEGKLICLCFQILYPFRNHIVTKFVGNQLLLAANLVYSYSWHVRDFR